MSKRVYIEHGDSQYRRLFIELGFELVDNPENATLICFTGGADVSPHLYHAARHRTTFSDAYRDAKEQRLFSFAQDNGIPCVGICRGAQFLNVMSGGAMFQDVTKHTAAHYITDHETGDVVYVSSTHHQMMMPAKDAKVVATSNLRGTREWFEGDIIYKDVADEDYEVVFYERTNSLCFQPHPEFLSPEYESMKAYFADLLNRFVVE